MTETQTKERERTVTATVATSHGQLTVTPKMDAFIEQVLPPDSREALWRSLPAHIKPEIFERNLYNALAANPDLLSFNPALVFREVSKAAGLGLLLDPLLGEAYIVTAYNYKSKKTEPQLRVGYKGMNKLARQSGNVTGLWCHEVCAKDSVVVDLGYPKIFQHKPVLFGDRGPIIGYAAVIAYKDGNFDFEPMSLKDCLDIRDRSDAWKAYKADKIKSTPWSTDESEMCKKTAFRRLMKRQDLSPEMRLAIDIEDRAEFPEMGRLPPRPAPIEDETPPPPPALTQQAPPSQPAATPEADESYVALVEAGRHDPSAKDEWADEDEPPLPQSNPAGTKHSSPPAETSAPAAASPPITPEKTAGAAFPSKGELLASIEQIESKLGCLHWATANKAATNALTAKDREEVMNAFYAKQEKAPA